MRITLLQEAQLEFLAAISHDEAERSGLGQRFKDEVDRSLLWIADLRNSTAQDLVGIGG